MTNVTPLGGKPVKRKRRTKCVGLILMHKGQMMTLGEVTQKGYLSLLPFLSENPA